MQLHWPTATIPPALLPDEAHVWAVPLVGSKPSHDELWARLSTDELAKADEFRLENPRRQFVITRGALRLLLGQYLGEQPEDIAFSLAAFEKPRLASKYAATNLHFNVSHSGDLALVAVAVGCEVGVDIDQFRTVEHLEQIARRFFHPQECDAVLATATAARNDAFLQCWTAKEAVLKAYGTGVAGSLSAFQAPLADLFEGWIDLPTMPKSGKASQCWLRRLMPCDGYFAAAAFMDSPRRVRCFAFSA